MIPERIIFVSQGITVFLTELSILFVLLKHEKQDIRLQQRAGNTLPINTT